MTDKDHPPQGNRDTTERIWDATRKTFHSVTFRANQYKRIVQKKIDLTSIHKKIGTFHSDLGKLIDERREAGVAELLAGEEVQELFQRLDSLRQAAAALEEELEEIKEEAPPPEEEAQAEEETVTAKTPESEPEKAEPEKAEPKKPKPRKPAARKKKTE